MITKALYDNMLRLLPLFQVTQNGNSIHVYSRTTATVIIFKIHKHHHTKKKFYDVYTLILVVVSQKEMFSRFLSAPQIL